MAFVAVTGSNGVWEYDNAATASDSYSDAKGTVSGGIRTQTRTFSTISDKLAGFSYNVGIGNIDVINVADGETVEDIEIGMLVSGPSSMVSNSKVVSVEPEFDRFTISPALTASIESGTLSFIRRLPHVTKTYIKCRKVGETAIRGELSKDYYDNQ